MLSLSCVSREINQYTKEPLVSLQAYTVVGTWTEGRWTRARLSSISPNAKVSGFGGGAFNIGERTYEVSTNVSLGNIGPIGDVAFNSTSKTLSVRVSSLDSLTQQGTEFSLRGDEPPTAHLTCFSQKGSTAGKVVALAQKEQKNQSSSNGSSSSSQPSNKPQFCNSNRPTGLAQCPAGQLNVGPRGANGAAVVDRTVTKCSVFSEISVADANAKAVAEANARAAGALNCWYVVTECRYTPAAVCPPGTVSTPPPPDCVIQLKKGGYFSQTSAEDALQKCLADAAKMPNCANYDPLCVKVDHSSSSSSSSSKTQKP